MDRLDRLSLFGLALYGLWLSAKSTATIKRLHREAQEGDPSAQHHFTQTRYAHVLGPRNSDLGLIFYSAVGAAALSGQLRRRLVLLPLLLGSMCSVILSLYLLWALFFRLRVRCTICIQGHIVNAATSLLLLKMWRRSRPPER